MLFKMNTNTGGKECAAWLRWEGAAELAALLFAYASHREPWWVFAALFLLPDLSMLGYLRDKGIGRLCYNLAHTYSTPAGLAAGQWVLSGQLSPLWLIWLAHIAFDRMMGYGLKESAGFGFTHLGPIGRTKAAGSR